ncbi:MAG: hypothetical protein JXR88_18405 [Clostridia bacterium]|nr:hypothetical protein [Clostridia bacterium]
MKSMKNDLNQIINLEKNTLSLEDIEWISKNLMKREEYILDYGERVYSNIFLRLTHMVFKEDEAFFYWQNILDHRKLLTEQLNRDPGIVMACLDYMSNICNYIEEATIIEENKIQYILSSNLTEKIN